MSRWYAIPGLFLPVVLGCEPERPPTAAGPVTATQEVTSEARFAPGEHEAILTYAGERGVFSDASSVDAVPEASRGMVRVALLGGAAPPPGRVWVANLRRPAEDGTFSLETVPRDLFEELAVGQGLSSKVELPEGLEPPSTVAASAGKVTVYKTQWCGVCKKLEAYLDRKGIEYESKDIEADREAAAELQAKAAARGLRSQSVPVIEIGDELLVGFDRKRLESMLGG